jgi:hypothetical protein
VAGHRPALGDLQAADVVFSLCIRPPFLGTSAITGGNPFISVGYLFFSYNIILMLLYFLTHE